MSSPPRFTPAFLSAQVPVLLISLPDQQQRREALLARGLPPEWVAAPFPAIDQRGAVVEALRVGALDPTFSIGAGRSLLAGEIGCAMSHRQAALWLAGSRYDLALVLEDDAAPQDSDWLVKSVAVARALLPHAGSGAAFVCLLGARPEQADTALRRAVVWRGSTPQGPQLFEHIDPGRTLWRAHAYMISRGAAERTRAREVRIATLADDWGARLRLGLIDALFYTRPVLIAQDEEIRSTIDPHQDRAHALPPQPGGPSLVKRIARSLAFRTMMARARWRVRSTRRLPAPEQQ